jgi:NO-binding membrane sensor protein with MHYT domain
MTTLDPPEPTTSLVSLVAAPAVWAIHFLASYATVAIWCAKVDHRFTGAQLAIAVYTLAALIDRDSAIGRHRFVAYATLLVAGLAGLAILYEALAIALVGSCG